MFRRLTVIALTVGLATPAFAEGIRESGAAAVHRAATQQATPQVTSPVSRRSHVWPGAILFAAGMGLATYGFLHTTDGDYVEPSDASKLSNTKLGIGGLALAAGGGAIMLLGTRPQGSASTTGVPGVGIAKRISW
jgi:hypothetical protein